MAIFAQVTCYERSESERPVPTPGADADSAACSRNISCVNQWLERFAAEPWGSHEQPPWASARVPL